MQKLFEYIFVCNISSALKKVDGEWVLGWVATTGSVGKQTYKLFFLFIFSSVFC